MAIPITYHRVSLACLNLLPRPSEPVWWVLILYSILETCYGQVASFFESVVSVIPPVLCGQGIVALSLNIKGGVQKGL